MMGNSESFPDQIHGESGGGNNQSRPRRRGLVYEQHDQDDRSAGNVESRYNGVTERPIRPFCIWPGSPQPEHAENRQNVEDQGGRYYVGQQVVVKAPVLGL